MATKGIDVDFWAQRQTLKPRRKLTALGWYDFISIGTDWWDMGVPEIPLDERYASFKRRLQKALSRVQ